MSAPIRALLVDDEALARRRLRSLLRDEPDIEIVGECGDGGSAVQEIEALEPDLVFLDVQMPEADGFDVLDAVGTRTMPVVSNVWRSVWKGNPPMRGPAPSGSRL